MRPCDSYLRYWCESFRLPSWPTDDLVARVRTVHEERLRTPYDAGRGVVAALPHQGNWDWAGAWACATGVPVMTVAERLRPERLYDEFVAFRSSLGHDDPAADRGRAADAAAGRAPARRRVRAACWPTVTSAAARWT